LHVFELQTHPPATHWAPIAVQFVHAAPAVPQSASAPEVTQLPPSQQPETAAHAVASQTQAPDALQICPGAQEKQAVPPVPHEPALSPL